jgi:hypothetical protein
VTVSIVVPFLNAERYLREAIASVQAQTWSDWELLLIDDGSSDASPAIATGAAVADPRIRVLARAPGAIGSAAAARNLGIEQARGEVVAFLDADDVYEPDYLEFGRAALDAHPEAMVVYGPTRWWHPGLEERDWIEDMRREAGRVHQPPALLNRVLLREHGHVPCTCSVLIRRGALEVTGGFDEAFQLYEDQTLWVKLLIRFPAYVSDFVGARYRQHDESTTAHAERSGAYSSDRPHQARLPFLTWVREYALASGLYDSSVERALTVAFAPYDRAGASLLDRCVLIQHRVTVRLRRAIRRLLPGNRLGRGGVRLR